MRAPLKFELDRRQGVLNIGYGAGSSPTFTNLTVTGVALFADGTAAAPSISFASDTDTGFYRNASGQMGFSANGALSLWFATGGRLYGASVEGYTEMPSGGGVNLVAAGSNKNITLTPSGTGVVQIGDGASAGQLTLRTSVANTGTAALSLFSTGNVDLQIRNSSSNLSFFRDTTEFARFNTSNRFLLGTTTDSGALLQLGGAGTTTAATNGIVFCTDTTIHRSSAGLLRFGGTQTTAALNMGTAGYVSLANVSGGSCEVRLLSAGSIDLVSNGTTALTLDASQNATFAGSVTATAGNYTNSAGGFLTWNGRSRLYSPSDGVVLLSNTAVSDFTRLQFGGTTASFPSLGRSGTQIEVLLADGSAYAKIAAGSVSLRTAAANGGAGEVVVGSTTQTTVGAAGGASALPATPSGFLKFKIGTVDYVFPYYAA